MKIKSITGFFLFIQILLLIAANGCKKESTVTVPELSTARLTNITTSSVSSGGNIFSDGGSEISSRGVCWSTNPGPTLSDSFSTDGVGAGPFSSLVTGLSSGTDYFIRAYATNSSGTAYGNEFIFMVPLADIDGNLYNTVIIGTQVWMTTNLKASKFNDNTLIPMVTDNSEWSALLTPGFCWYRNDMSKNIDKYGALYNWYSVNTGKICPVGWHVPGDVEWIILEEYLGGEFVASGKLKEEGSDHWADPNFGASNDFGWSALPGGYRTGLVSGSFDTQGYNGWWWTSTEIAPLAARARQMSFDGRDIARGSALKKNGYSVRCVMDITEK